MTDVEDAEEEFFFFFCMLRMEGELHNYSSCTLSEWKESFIRNSLLTLILASPCTEEEQIFFFSELKGSFIMLKKHRVTLENLCSPWYQPLNLHKKKIFFFFYILRVEGEFQYAKQTWSTSWIPNFNSLTEKKENYFFSSIG